MYSHIVVAVLLLVCVSVISAEQEDNATEFIVTVQIDNGSITVVDDQTVMSNPAAPNIQFTNWYWFPDHKTLVILFSIHATNQKPMEVHFSHNSTWRIVYDWSWYGDVLDTILQPNKNRFIGV